MTMRKTLAGLALATIMLAIPFSSPRADYGRWVQGFGNYSCAKFLNASVGTPFGEMGEHPWNGKTFVTENAAYQEWLEGYISGFNMFFAFGEPGQPDIRVDIAGIDAWVRNYCQTHPADSLTTAAWSFIASRSEAFRSAVDDFNRRTANR
jgi:hypothetical protein